MLVNLDKVGIPTFHEIKYATEKGVTASKRDVVYRGERKMFNAILLFQFHLALFLHSYFYPNRWIKTIFLKGTFIRNIGKKHITSGQQNSNVIIYDVDPAKFYIDQFVAFCSRSFVKDFTKPRI